MSDLFSDEYFMQKALDEAHKALEADEVPVGAIVVANKQIIARGWNHTETLNDVTAHAEMQVITAAAEYLGGKYLHDCTLYVTLEPCVMCAGALAWSQISRIVYGAKDEKKGYSLHGNLLHPKTQIVGGVLQDKCGELLSDFFKKKR